MAQHGEAALRPALDKGKYIAPLVPPRLAANLRKRAIADGSFGSFSPEHGGWDPEWDEPKKMFIMKRLKGHKRERDREQRAGKVTIAMQGMAERFEKMRSDNLGRKPKQDIAFMFKRVAEMSATKKKR